MKGTHLPVAIKDIQAKYQASSYFKDIYLLKSINNSLEHFILRQKREIFLQWELNPMPLICQMSILDC